MVSKTSSPDGVLYQRSFEIFSNKHAILPTDRVNALAEEVINYLAELAPSERPVDVMLLSSDTLSDFCDLLLQTDSDAPWRFINCLKRDGVSPDIIRYELIARAAQDLGARWDRSEAKFVDVTIATGKLYALIRSLSADITTYNGKEANERHALFASVPGETHTLGVSLASDTFREAGWCIDLRIGDTHEDILEHAVSTKPTVIGLSLSTKSAIGDLIRLVFALRIALPETIIGVAPALDMGNTNLTKIVDIDLVFHDARRALSDLEGLLRLRR